MNTLKGRDILHGNQFSRQDIQLVMETADRFEAALQVSRSLNLMQGYILATLFFEPSTRTRLSFEAAMQRLGGGVISVASGMTSSAAKGETIADTARTVAQYADLIVIRHPQVGSAKEAADAADVPVINAGDGAGQHPTQALLDVYTIQRERGTVDGLTIALVGDLKYGRTVHALVELLRHFDVKLWFVSPPALAMPSEITAGLRDQGVEITETDDLRAAMAVADVVYVTRIQKERFADPAEYERLKGVYVVDRQMVSEAKPGVTIMHPLPRVDEITPEVDAYPGAAYFRQVRNGVVVRMALIALIADRV